MNHNFALGRYGEQVALNLYQKKGYLLWGKNIHIQRIGEIDLIFINQKQKYFFEVIFVEVKTRTSSRNGYGYNAIDKRKILTMKKCAVLWLQENKTKFNGYCKLRLDVVSIDFKGGKPLINVFENIS